MKSISYAALLIAMFFYCAVSGFAETDFNPFWLKFKVAVAKKDKAAVASMTKLPYMLESKPLDKAQFIAKYDEIFPRATVNCFTKAKPTLEHGNCFVFCYEQIYCFSKEKGQWKFTEISPND
jgi:hypothetical protein